MFLVLITFVIIFCLVIRLHEKNTNAICISTKKLEGKVAVVTGGTAGIGLKIATDLAKRGAKVVIACPFVDEGEIARKIIIDDTGNQKVFFKLLNLESFSSVRKFASDIMKEETRLDILINNAGVGQNFRIKTIETNITMQVNYLGHFLLTILLLPLIKKTGTHFEPSRIINTGSITHWLGRVNFDNTNYSNAYNRIIYYSNSKYCCVLIGHVLSQKLKGSSVVVNAVDPGLVGTKIYDSITGGFILSFLLKLMFKTPWEGAQTALYAALDDKAGQVTGQFFKNCELSRAKSSAYDDGLGEKLWEHSVKLCKLGSDELDKCLNFIIK